MYTGTSCKAFVFNHPIEPSFLFKKKDLRNGREFRAIPISHMSILRLREANCHPKIPHNQKEKLTPEF